MPRKTSLALILSSLLVLTSLGLALGVKAFDLLPTFRSRLFTGSKLCGDCHGYIDDNEGNDISADTLWRSSSMANSGKDPFMAAKLESEIARTPALAAALEATCPICHQPMARTEAVADGATVALFGDGFLNPGNPLHEAAMDGISCTLCHQITADGLGDPSSFSGNYVIDTTVDKPERVVYGKYPDPVALLPMEGEYEPHQGLHEQDSAICAVCHEQYVTPSDEEGNALAVSHTEQMPYQEWQNSIYGDGLGVDDQTCQDCHMPEVPGEVNISNDADNPRANYNKHTFEGGNTLLLAILRDNWDELDVRSTSTQMNDSIARTQALLQNKTAELTVTRAEVIEGTAYVDVAINNLVGHKFPTGVPFRRVWVHLTLQDYSGSTIFESGAPLPSGQIAGNAADFDLATYEPHYDLITSPDQVQIYEPITIGEDGQVTYTILRVVGFIKDNRLLPPGYDKSTAPADIAVFGNAASDEDFVGGGDVVHYQISLPEGTSGPKVTAELLFQPISYPSVQDLLVDLPEAGTPQAAGQVEVTFIDRFVQYYAAADKSPELLGSVSQVLDDPTAITLQQISGERITLGHLLTTLFFLISVMTGSFLLYRQRKAF